MPRPADPSAAIRPPPPPPEGPAGQHNPYADMRHATDHQADAQADWHQAR